MIISPWSSPREIGHYRFSDVLEASTIKSAWERLLSEDSSGVMSSRYARLLSIETNEIEKVFALGGESVPRLVKVGFYTGACQGRRRRSRTAKKLFPFWEIYRYASIS